jgi:putative acetyltransferase
MMIELEKYRQGDEAEIFKLVSSVLKEYGLETNTGSTDSDLDDIEKSYIQNGGIFKVLKDDNKIIGSYGLFKVDAQTCELRKMYLYSQYKSQGLGKQMLIDAFEEAKRLGFKTMILETNKVLVEAKGLYQKYGFKEFTPAHLSDRCDIAMKNDL